MKLNITRFAVFAAVLILSCLIVSCTKKENKEKVSNEAPNIEQAKQTHEKITMASIEERYGISFDSSELTFLYNLQRYKEAVEYYEKIEKPDTESKLAMAVIYYTIQDYKKSADLFQELDIQDFILAKYYMAIFYLHGIGGIEQDYQKSFDLFKYCADKGNIKAKKILFEIFYFGDAGGKKDLKKAFDLCKEVADSGNMSAKTTLITYYLTGVGTEKNYQKALEVFESMGEYADKDLINKFADMYYLGMDEIQQNSKKAADLYNKAAAKGSTYAKYMLKSFEFSSNAKDRAKYMSSYNNQDVKKADDNQLEKSAEEGNVDAQLRLGLEQKKLEKYEEALEWFKKAAYQGNPKAQYEVGAIYQHCLINRLTPLGMKIFTEIDLETVRKESFKWFEIAASQGEDRSLFELEIGYCMIPQQGGIKQDFEKADEYKKKAIINGNLDAQILAIREEKIAQKEAKK